MARPASHFIIRYPIVRLSAQRLSPQKRNEQRNEQQNKQKNEHVLDSFAVSFPILLVAQRPYHTGRTSMLYTSLSRLRSKIFQGNIRFENHERCFEKLREKDFFWVFFGQTPHFGQSASHKMLKLPHSTSRSPYSVTPSSAVKPRPPDSRIGKKTRNQN